MEREVGVDTLKKVNMGADSYSSASSRLITLQNRKQLLEESIAQKNEELRNLCVQEAQLTSIMPPEIPLEPGETLPNYRRKVGTAFEYPQNLISKLNSEKESIASLETEIQFQRCILENASRFAHDAASLKEKRKNTLICEQTKHSLKDMEEKLENLKLQMYGSQPIVTNNQLKQKKKPRPPFKFDTSSLKNNNFGSHGEDMNKTYLLHHTYPYQDINHEMDSERYMQNRGHIIHQNINYTGEMHRNSNYGRSDFGMSYTLDRIPMNNYTKERRGSGCSQNSAYTTQNYPNQHPVMYQQYSQTLPLNPHILTSHVNPSNIHYQNPIGMSQPNLNYSMNAHIIQPQMNHHINSPMNQHIPINHQHISPMNHHVSQPMTQHLGTPPINHHLGTPPIHHIPATNQHLGTPPMNHMVPPSTNQHLGTPPINHIIPPSTNQHLGTPPMNHMTVPPTNQHMRTSPMNLHIGTPPMNHHVTSSMHHTHPVNQHSSPVRTKSIDSDPRNTISETHNGYVQDPYVYSSQYILNAHTPIPEKLYAVESDFSNANANTIPLYQPEPELLSTGLGGYWMKNENNDCIWVPTISPLNTPVHWPRDKRFGSLDRRKDKFIHNKHVLVDRKHTISTSSQQEPHVSPLPPQTMIRSNSTNDCKPLVRTQSLGSVGAQTIDILYSNDDASSYDSDGQSFKERGSSYSRKSKPKGWCETSLDGPPVQSDYFNSDIMEEPPYPPPSRVSFSSPHTPKLLEIPAESNPSPSHTEANNEIFNNNGLMDLPKNCTVVQAGQFKPYREVTKPFEMEDFYKYSTKFREKKTNTDQRVGKDIEAEARNQEMGNERRDSFVNKSAREGYESQNDGDAPGVVQKSIYQPLQPMKCQPFAPPN